MTTAVGDLPGALGHIVSNGITENVGEGGRAGDVGAVFTDHDDELAFIVDGCGGGGLGVDGDWNGVKVAGEGGARLVEEDREFGNRGVGL